MENNSPYEEKTTPPAKTQDYPFNVDLLKREHGKIFLVEVEPETPGELPLQFVFKMADRKIMSASAKVAMTDPLASVEVMVKNTLVWGDQSALNDIRVFSAVSAQVERIHEPRTAKLKNL